MPTPLKHSTNMRKNLTKAERTAREAAERGLEATSTGYLISPKWLSDEARRVFEQTKSRLRDYQLLEKIDIDLLALYADAIARYQAGIADLEDNASVERIKTIQAWSRIALSYADKLGFSQTARARLARKKAIEMPPDDMEALLADVNDFVNGGGRD